MRIETIVNDNQYIYDENFFTGKKTLIVNGEEYRKVKRNLYENDSGSTMCVIRGNFATGVTLDFDGEKVFLGKLKWYEYLLAYLPLAAIGFGVFLDPVGAGIAGALSVLAVFFNIFILRTRFNNLLKVVGCIFVTAVLILFVSVIYPELKDFIWRITN